MKLYVLYIVNGASRFQSSVAHLTRLGNVTSTGTRLVSGVLVIRNHTNGNNAHRGSEIGTNHQNGGANTTGYSLGTTRHYLLCL